jgi:predicted O-methyltransferase YrrM
VSRSSADVDAWLADALLPADAPSETGGAAVSPLQGALLEVLARGTGARRILELGTLHGYSTLWLARALPPGGELVTIEADAENAAAARRRLAGVDGVTLKEGRALDVLPALDGPFDLIFVDADKRSNPDYLPLLLGLSRPGTLIVADNVVREGGVVDGEDPSAAGARRFLELAGAEPRLGATVLQTVGAKGWDGIALAVVL